MPWQGLLLVHVQHLHTQCQCQTLVPQVAELGVPYILMHMRGDPATMQSRENTSYEDVCTDVGRELQAAAGAAMTSGIEPWRLILDPGGVSGLQTFYWRTTA